MDNLSSRHRVLLKAIIDEYLSTAEPVGSLVLEKKYSLGVSPATIRNEMANLTSQGYLKQPHTSAGRVPTPKAMKFYITSLMDEKGMSVSDEVRVNEEIKRAAPDLDEVMKRATHALSDNTAALAVATNDEGAVWSHGYANVLGYPEFMNYHVCQSVFGMVEEVHNLHEIMFQRLTGLTPIEVLFGEELGWEFFEPVGIVASRFRVKDKNYALGVVGPFRLNYARVIPTVRYYGDLMRQALSG